VLYGKVGRPTAMRDLKKLVSMNLLKTIDKGYELNHETLG